MVIINVICLVRNSPPPLPPPLTSSPPPPPFPPPLLPPPPLLASRMIPVVSSHTPAPPVETGGAVFEAVCLMIFQQVVHPPSSSMIQPSFLPPLPRCCGALQEALHSQEDVWIWGHASAQSLSHWTLCEISLHLTIGLD